MEGFYGDPTRGIPCLPCNCPVVGNGFSPTCYLNNTDGLSTCNACAVGYTGRNCEICMDGFFGNPMVCGVWSNIHKCLRNMEVNLILYVCLSRVLIPFFWLFTFGNSVTPALLVLL